MGIVAKDYTLTLTGAAQQLSVALLAANYALGRNGDEMERDLWLQPDGANSGIIYVGGTQGSGSNTSSTNYGFRLEKPVSTIPQAPFSFNSFYQGTITLGAIWVFGTNGDKLHVFGIVDR